MGPPRPRRPPPPRRRRRRRTTATTNQAPTTTWDSRSSTKQQQQQQQKQQQQQQQQQRRQCFHQQYRRLAISSLIVRISVLLKKPLRAFPRSNRHFIFISDFFFLASINDLRVEIVIIVEKKNKMKIYF